MIAPTLAYGERVLAPSSFDLAAWTKVNTGVVTANSNTAPDGTITADTLNDTDAVNRFVVTQPVTIPADAMTRVASIYLRAGTSPVCAIQLIITGGVAINYGIAFNPSNGQFSAASGLGSVPLAVGVTTLPLGWFRLSFTYLCSNNTLVNFQVTPAWAAALAGSGLGFTTAGDATRTGTVIAWGASSKDSFNPTYPPVGKNLAPELGATRTDSISTSGIKQSVVERIDQFQDYNFPFVPQLDIPSWTVLMNNLLGGGTLTYFPDSTDLSTSTDFTTDDMGWKPARGVFGHAKFSIRLRQVVVG